MNLKRKDLLGIEELTVEEINLILDTALPMKDIVQRDIKKVPTLRGRSVVNLFYEPSTRTRTSFELAGKFMSADTVNIATSSSSVAKGETLKDTAKTIEVMGADVVVLRHGMPGAARILAETISSHIINAGDGAHEHPTQALLDLFTIREEKGRIAGLTVTLVGDIVHSRVVRSNILALTKLGASVRLVGPPTLMPYGIEDMGVEVYYSLEEALKDSDVVMALRIQKERQQRGLFPSLREYSRLYGLTEEKLSWAKEDCLLMHPGPINRGVELSSPLADGISSLINRQVTNGVAVRMAILFLLIGGGKSDITA